jgi:hypothetical protein
LARVPDAPKIYHIVHVDKLSSIVGAGGIFCDAEMERRKPVGTTIGMTTIKERRLRLPVRCHRAPCG